MKGWRSWDLGRSGTSAPERPAKWDLPRAPGAIAHGHTPPKPVPPCENKIRGGSTFTAGSLGKFTVASAYNKVTGATKNTIVFSTPLGS